MEIKFFKSHVTFQKTKTYITRFTKIISRIEKSRAKRENRTLLILRNAIKRERKCGGGACGNGKASTQQQTTERAVFGEAGDTRWHRDQDILSFYVYQHQAYFNCHKIIKMFKLQN